ncbi:unnamed protein product [Closterium sp. NIES-54]
MGPFLPKGPPYYFFFVAALRALASPTLLTFDAEGQAVAFDVWLDDLQRFLQCDSRDGLSLFDLTSGTSTAPAADADSTVRSQWLTRNAAARLAVRIARYSSPATAALSRLMLPYLFPDLAAFATVTDLITHLRTSDTRYRAALFAEDHFLSLCPTTLTVDLLEERLLAAETSITAVGTSRGDPRTHFFEGCSPVPLLPSVVSAAAVDLVGTESVSAASAPSERRHISKAKRGTGAGGGNGGDGSGGRGGGGGGGGGGGRGGGFGGSGGAGGSGGSGGRGGGVGGGGGGGGAGRGGAVQRGPQQQQRSRETPSPHQLREWSAGRQGSGGTGPCTYVLRTGDRTGDRTGEQCGGLHATQRCFGRLTDAWCAQFPDATEIPRWHDLFRSGVAIFDLDFDAILAAMYAVSISAEGDCYVCVSPDPGIETAALGASESAAPGASESALSGTASAQAFHSFTLDSGASRSFFRDRTTLTPLNRPVAVSLADPSGCPVLARYSTVLPCPAAPSGSLSGLYLPSFSTNLVSGADLQDGGVDQFTPAGQRVTHCTCAQTGRHLATFTRRPGSSLYTQTTESPPVAASGQVAASSQVFAAASRSGPESAPCSCRLLSHQTLLPICTGSPPGRLVCTSPSERPDGIRQTFTLPTSPQQNGIAERRIGMVMDVARTSMIHAAAPHFLWPFAVQYAAHQINLQPRVSLPETSPTLRWTGKVGDASAFRVWGSRAFVRDLSADKLSSHSVPCVFLGFPLDAPGWQFYHPTSRRVLSSQDVTFDESVPYYRLFPYRTAPLPPPPLFLAPGPPPVDPLPPQGPAPSGVSQVDAAEPVQVAADSGASRGAKPGRAESGGAASGGAVPGGAEPGGAGSGGAEPGGAEPWGAGSGGAVPERVEPWGTASEGADPGAARSGGVEPARAGPGGPSGAFRAAGAGGAASAGGSAATGGAGAGGATGAGPGGSTSARGAGAMSPGGARTGVTGAAVPAGAPSARAGGATGVGVAGGTGAGGAAGVGAAGGTGAGGAAGVGADAGGAGVVPAGSGGAARPRPYFVPLLEQVLGLPPSSGPAPSLECPPPVQSESQLQLASPMPAPSPYAGPTGGLAERREPESCPALPVRTARTSRRVPRPLPPAVPGTHQMTLRPSTASQRVPLPSPSASSLPALAALASDSLRVASPTVTRLLATVVTDPSFESTAASALVTELVDFAAHYRLDFAICLDVESASVCPPSVGDPNAPDIPTPRSNAEAIEGPDSSQWQAVMDAEMASWKSTGIYIDEVPPPWANIVTGLMDFQGEAAAGFSACLQGTLRGSRLHLHEEIWLRHPPGFTGSFPSGTKWSLRQPVYGLRQAPRGWHDTLRTTLAALGFAPSTADPSLFLRTDTLLPPFYILVYVDDLVLQRFDFTYSSPQATPLSTRHSLSALPSDESVEPSGPYPELVGCLMYLMICTRPDLAYPLSILARYVAPGRHRPEHMAAAKRVLRYLCSISGLGLVLGGRSPMVLTGHADASWVDELATQWSSQGYTFSLGSGSVSWRSTRSSFVLSSSCEAEIYAGAMAAQELRWLTYLLTDLGEPPRSPPVLYVDNKAMLALCREHRLEHRTKHIALRYFLARELQQRGQLRLAYVASQANTADIFTKALQPCDHQRFCTMLGLVPTWPHLLTS